MRTSSRSVVAFLLLISMFALPANAQLGIKFPPIPGRDRGTNPNALAAAAQAEIEKQIEHMVAGQVGADAPLKLDQTTAYPKVADLPDFRPQLWKPQSQSDLNKPLLPGDYSIPVACFCTQYSIHVPGNGTPYKLAPVEGREAISMNKILARGTLQGIPHDTLMWISWRMEGCVPLNQWPAEYQAIVHKIDPEDELTLQGDFLAQVKKVYDDHNHIPFVKLPPFDKILSGMGEAGQYVLELERSRKILTDKTHAEEMNPDLLFEPQGDGLPQHLPAVQGAPSAPWSLVRPGIYARFTVQSGWQGSNLFEFRIMPEAITAVSPSAAISCACSPSAEMYQGVPMGVTLRFPTIDTVLGVLKNYTTAQVIRTAEGVVIRVVAVAGEGVIGVEAAPVVGTLIISYSLYKACQALILMSEPPKDNDNRGSTGRAKFSELDENALPQEEREAIGRATQEIKDGELPGRDYRNDPTPNGDHLPGDPGKGGYTEYDVDPAPGTKNRGTRRIVVNSKTGKSYYTNTHYGDSGQPSFYEMP